MSTTRNQLPFPSLAMHQPIRELQKSVTMPTKTNVITSERIWNTEKSSQQNVAEAEEKGEKKSATEERSTEGHQDVQTNEQKTKSPVGSAHKPIGSASLQGDYYNRYMQLSQNVAQRYPNPGPPRERHGSVGGSWRHIKEVQGHSSRVLFVDGMVRIYDQGYKYNPAFSSQHSASRRKPFFAPISQSTESGLVSWQQKEKVPPINDTTAHLPGGPTKYKGFYNYRHY